MSSYMSITLEFANLVISLFALIYGVFFIVFTARHKHKLPWIFLTISIALFFIFQLLFLLSSFGIESELLNLSKLFAGTGFASMVLLSFVYQMDLILKSSYILIQKKGSKKIIPLKNKK